jgi:hypothetical protein
MGEMSSDLPAVPTRSNAWAQLETTVTALGSARPVSSHADISMRLKMKSGSSPAAYHACKPVHCRIGVAAAETFYEMR